MIPIHAFTRGSVGANRFPGWLRVLYATASFVYITPRCQRNRQKNRTHPFSVPRVYVRSDIPCRVAEMKSVDTFFPSPQQVVGTDIATLRTAGLSARKAEYGEGPLLSCLLLFRLY